MDLPKRKLNRLCNYEYLDGCYFVTICTKNRIKHFGEMRNNEMILNQWGKTAEQQWLWLKENFDYIRLDEFIIMPNHLHGIIIIDRFNTGDVIKKPENDTKEILNRQILALSNIIGAFKTTSSKLIHQKWLFEFNWQRSFFDRIIRNEKELKNIRNYILNNPYNRQRDVNNQENLFM